LEFLPFDPDRFDGFTGPEAVFYDLAAFDVLQLRPHKRTPVAGIHMLELDDLPQLVVVLDDKAGPEIGCRRHNSLNLLA
jgi:hypothetical protein